MCQFKSGIILRNRVVLTPDGNESHTDVLNQLGMEDNYMNASKAFVKAELIPKHGNRAADASEWTYRADQDIVPDWYETNAGRYEMEFRNAVRDYMHKRICVICNRAWTVMKTDETGTYYLMDGSLGKSEFGESNNYADSYVRRNLNNSDLARDLREEFGERLSPIRTNLLSLDGLKDYGEVDGDILAIPTLDLYRECREHILNSDGRWWLATPNSTPSGCSSGCVHYVDAGGDVDYDWCDAFGAVRPFFILPS